MDFAKIPVGRAPPHHINGVVEIPQGGEPVKYEFDKLSGAIFVDPFLHMAMFYPGNYGFVPHTLAEDGDPLYVLIVGPGGGSGSGGLLPADRSLVNEGRAASVGRIKPPT